MMSILDNKTIIGLDLARDEPIEIGIKEGIFAQPTKTQVNLQFLSPPFVDAHSHLLNYIIRKSWFDLSHIENKSKLFSLIQQVLENNPYFLGYNFDESKWPSKEYPTRKELDTLEKKKPILLLRIDGHFAVVNSGLIELLNLPKNIFMDSEEGFLVEEKVGLVIRLIIEKLGIKGDLTAVEDYLKLGILATDDMGSIVYPAEYKKIIKRLHVKFYVMLQTLKELKMELEDLARDFGVGFGGLKIILDGSIGARTAALYEPYRDDPHNKGLLLLDKNELYEVLDLAKKLNLEVAIHAIGDRAIDLAIEALIRYPSKLNPRIEHFEMPHEDHISKIKKYGIIPSMQPNFIANWQQKGGLYERRLGWERTRDMNPLADILASRGMLVFGSDNMPLGPIYGIYGALMHPREDQRLDFRTALLCYTYYPARIQGFSSQYGFQFGAPANFLVWPGNIKTIGEKNPKALLKIRPIPYFKGKALITT